MKYIASPEFHRNLWLKFTPLKLVAVPLLLTICVTIALNASPEDSLKPVQAMAMFVFYAAVFLWGNYEAGSALQDEVKDKTWDQQKMSAITPAQLGFGKLFGATSYVWYIGLTALGIVCYTYTQMPHEKSLGWILLSLVTAGVFGHAVAFLFSLADLSSSARQNTRNYIPASKGPFLMGLVASHTTTKAFDAQYLLGAARKSGVNTVEWFGHTFGSADFALGAVLVFGAWCLTGVYRTTKAELMYRLTPVAWVGFVTTLAVFAGGFVRAGAESAAYLGLVYSVMCGVYLAMTYIAMLAEAPDLRRYRRLGAALRAKDRMGMFFNMPKWVATLPFMLAFYLIALAALTMYAGDDKTLPGFAVFTAAAILFAARDGLVMHALSARGARTLKFQRLLYYVMVYALLPLLHATTMASNTGMSDIVNSIGGGDAAHAVSDKLKILAWYYPTRLTDPTAALVPVTVEIVLAALFLRWRLKK